MNLIQVGFIHRSSDHWTVRKKLQLNMTINLGDLDAHEQPSDELRAEWKSFSKKEPAELLNETKLDDPRLPLSQTGFVSAGSISKNQLTEAFKQIGISQEAQEDAQIIHHPLLPGVMPIFECLHTLN